MKALTEFIIALADYARVEGRRVRRALYHAVMLIGLALAALVLALIGMVTIVLSLYAGLAEVMHHAVALLLAGLAALVLGGVTIWMIKLHMR